MFELKKRNFLFQAETAKEAEKKTHNQILELLRLFPDGVLILNKDFKIKYKNEAIEKIINLYSFNTERALREIKFSEDNILLTQKLQSLDFEDKRSFSLGMTKVDNLIFEWNSKIID